ncbi:MAG: J domain-containing protein [Bdellovibrionaceae bacterium]|nr:J domain-containing protein [Pseudobdellovibrionaceae bacterium]
MGRFVEFASLLEDKIRRELRDEKNVETPRFPSETELFPSGMAWLMGQVQSARPSANRARSAYGVKPKVRPAHRFDATQTDSFNFVKNAFPELENNFSPRELKTAYRKAAMKLHPDQGGTSEQFRDLHRHFENLRRLFHEPKTSRKN